MTHIVSLTLLAAFASLGVTVGWGGARAQEAPVYVLTDSVEYCNKLQTRIEQRPNHPAAVRRLELEGRRMCDHGDVRGGIARLRQALVMMTHPPEAP